MVAIYSKDYGLQISCTMSEIQLCCMLTCWPARELIRLLKSAAGCCPGIEPDVQLCKSCSKFSNSVETCWGGIYKEDKRNGDGRKMPASGSNYYSKTLLGPGSTWAELGLRA
eukprot:TRINITY_DN2990_c0_g3_i5.p3 TRINITY_DN2990_c0_g3~~TRINITY_DN2990_c0_g3_i5.p3  ORF type:complete len:112 (+),score=7.06 TRINITY_DN2990_c0_g3_i5:221-556(+)